MDIGTDDILLIVPVEVGSVVVAAAAAAAVKKKSFVLNCWAALRSGCSHTNRVADIAT